MNYKLLAFVIFCTTVVMSCTSTPASTPTLSPTFSATPTFEPTQTQIATSTPRLTNTPAPTRTPRPTASHIPSPTPVPNLVVWYLQNEQVHRYDMRTWSDAVADIPNNEDVERAALSPDGRWLAYADTEVLRIFDLQDEEEWVKFAIITRPDHGNGGLVFSNDDSLLAFEDVEGLKIISLAIRGIQLRKPNDLRGLDDFTLNADAITSYHPISWSPNNQWLLIHVGKWEGSVPDLLLRMSNNETLTAGDGCFSGNWSPDNTQILGVEWLDGFSGCGEEPGIYAMLILGNTVSAKRIYYEIVSQQWPYAAIPSWSALSPDGKWIAFTFESNDYSTIQENVRLLIISPDGTEGRELAFLEESSDGNALWAGDSQSIYYIQFEDKKSVIYRTKIDPIDESRLATIQGQYVIQALSPDNKWMLLNQCGGDCQRPKDIQLLNLQSKAVVDVSNGSTEVQFLGWEEIEE